MEFINRRGAVVIFDPIKQSKVAMDSLVIQREMQSRKVRFLPAQVIRRVLADKGGCPFDVGTCDDGRNSAIDLLKQGVSSTDAIQSVIDSRSGDSSAEWRVVRQIVGQHDLLEKKPYVVVRGDSNALHPELWRGDAGKTRRFGSAEAAEKAARKFGLIV